MSDETLRLTVRNDTDQIVVAMAREVLELRAAIPYIGHNYDCPRDSGAGDECTCGYASLPAWIRELAEGGGE